MVSVSFYASIDDLLKRQANYTLNQTTVFSNRQIFPLLAGRMRRAKRRGAGKQGTAAAAWTAAFGKGHTQDTRYHRYGDSN